MKNDVDAQPDKSNQIMSQKSRSEFAVYYGLGCILMAIGV